MIVTKKYNELCKKFKNKLQTFEVQYEHEHDDDDDDLFELIPTDKHEYFESL